MTNNTDKTLKSQQSDIKQIGLSDYEKKKRRNYDFVKFMFGKVSDLRLNAIDECGANLLFLADEKKEKHRLKSGFFCKNRFCPYCAWRKARKDHMKLAVIMKMMSVKYKYEFLLVTLTTPNVKAENLEKEIKFFNASFMKMMKRKKFRGWGEDRRGNLFSGFVKGYVKRIEVTYNKKRDDYNPHIHAVFAVRRSYFKKNYLKHSEWLDEWRDVTGMPEITQVDVRRLNDDNLEKSIYEVSKYAVKDSDYLINQDVFDVFFSSLKHKRVLVYGGCMYDYARMYENGELDDWKTKDTTDYVYLLMSKFNYDSMEYENKYRVMTEEEKRETLNLFL
ncbi:protein rep [Enterococcus hirae]|uniref:protein rep n=1 Tax=Enterococcus hirae TaxID=1354 RepID=UPI00207363F1|nr:protein rep [Enterococcus hirae]